MCTFWKFVFCIPSLYFCYYEYKKRLKKWKSTNNKNMRWNVFFLASQKVLYGCTAPVHFLTIMNPNGTNDNSFERVRQAESNELETNEFGQFWTKLWSGLSTTLLHLEQTANWSWLRALAYSVTFWLSL